MTTEVCITNGLCFPSRRVVQFLVGTTHFDDEDGLFYVTKEVDVDKSPMGPVTLVSRDPIMKNGIVSKR